VRKPLGGKHSILNPERKLRQRRKRNIFFFYRQCIGISLARNKLLALRAGRLPG
jgi:hypothetical protein